MYLFLFSCLSLSIRWMHVPCVDMHVFVMRNRKHSVRIYMCPCRHVKSEPDSNTASVVQGRGDDHQDCSQKNQSLPHTLFFLKVRKNIPNSRPGKVHDCVWYAKSTTSVGAYIWNLSASDSAIPLEQCCVCDVNLTLFIHFSVLLTLNDSSHFQNLGCL